MYGFEDVMLVGIDPLLFGLCMPSPQQKDDIRTFLGDDTYDFVRELFPTLLGMRIGFSGSHRHHRVEQEHALLRPSREISVCTSWNPEVLVDLLEDVL